MAFEAPGAQIARLEFSGCRVRRLHTTAREPKRAHLRVLVFKTPPKINEKTPREGTKNEILRREREKKKERNFGRSGGGRSEPGGGPAEEGPLAQIGLATKINKAMAQIGQSNAGSQNWSKLVPPDQKRPKSASLRLSPKSAWPWPKSAWPNKVVAKQGRGQSRPGQSRS